MREYRGRHSEYRRQCSRNGHVYSRYRSRVTGCGRVNKFTAPPNNRGVLRCLTGRRASGTASGVERVLSIMRRCLQYGVSAGSCGASDAFPSSLGNSRPSRSLSPSRGGRQFAGTVRGMVRERRRRGCNDGRVTSTGEIVEYPGYNQPPVTYVYSGAHRQRCAQSVVGVVGDGDFSQ